MTKSNSSISVEDVSLKVHRRISLWILSLNSTMSIRGPERWVGKRICLWLFFLLLTPGLTIFTLIPLLGRIAPTQWHDQLPILENATSMFIQAMDQGIVIPLCILAGILL